MSEQSQYNESELEEVPRPDCVTDDHLVYLDELRESGVTNMFGAGQYVQERFDMNRRDAQAVVLYWMKTFTTRRGE